MKYITDLIIPTIFLIALSTTFEEYYLIKNKPKTETCTQFKKQLADKYLLKANEYLKKVNKWERQGWPPESYREFIKQKAYDLFEKSRCLKNDK